MLDIADDLINVQGFVPRKFPARADPMTNLRSLGDLQQARRKDGNKVGENVVSDQLRKIR